MINKRITQSSKAGLAFPVGRIGRYMRSKSGWKKRFSADGPVYMTAVMEFLCAEILEIAGFSCLSDKKKLIKPRHIELSVRKDKAFAKLL